MDGWAVYPVTKADRSRFDYMFYKNISRPVFVMAGQFTKMTDSEIGLYPIFLPKHLLNGQADFIACQTCSLAGKPTVLNINLIK